VAGAEIVPCALSAEVFAALDAGAVDAAAIPIENSLAGSVLEHFDLLLKHDVKVVEETLVRIRHNLIAMPGASVGEIERVLSHPVALAQCRRFLAAHPAMKAIAFYDTAGSVKQLMELRQRNVAAIASEAAVAIYGAEILERDIEDNPENYTRFFLVRRAGEAETEQELTGQELTHKEANKMSIAFTLENRPGSLVAALSALSATGTNLTKIESRPVQGKPWEYIFYVDCQIGSSAEGTRALEALDAHCGMVKELGRYREARSA
jgi:prephenate dehydratase